MLGPHKLSVYRRLAGTLVRRRRKKGKMSFKERLAVVKKALREGRIRCRRSKDIARAQLYLRLFENAMARLEADPRAMETFRKKRIPELEARIRVIETKILVQVAKAQKFAKQGEQKKSREAWRKDHGLAAARRALRIELQMFQQLLRQQNK